MIAWQQTWGEMQNVLHQRWDLQRWDISAPQSDCAVVVIGAVGGKCPPCLADARQAFPLAAVDCSVPSVWFPGRPSCYFEVVEVVAG